MSTRETVTIKSDFERQRVATWAKNVEIGTVVTFRKKSRSSEQNAKLWSMLGEVATQVDWYGTKMDSADWKDVFTASLRHARVVPGIDKGTFVPLGMHTSTMTIEEMTNLIELIYAFGAEHNVIFKDPKDNSNSGAPSPDADAPSSAEAGDSSPQLPASNPSDDMRGQLIAFTANIVGIIGNSQLPYKQMLYQCEQTVADWKYAISEAGHAKMDSISLGAEAVIRGKRTLTQFINYVATDLLDCAVGELGG